MSTCRRDERVHHEKRGSREQREGDHCVRMSANCEMSSAIEREMG
jgi:hypothetical protein